MILEREIPTKENQIDEKKQLKTDNSSKTFKCLKAFMSPLNNAKQEEAILTARNHSQPTNQIYLANREQYMRTRKPNNKNKNNTLKHN